MKDAEYIKEKIREDHEKLLDARSRLLAIESALQAAGFAEFQARNVLEAVFSEKDTCPACGHRRTKDG